MRRIFARISRALAPKLRRRQRLARAAFDEFTPQVHERVMEIFQASRATKAELLRLTPELAARMQITA